MADLQKIVSILFQGDDQVSQTINTMSGNMGSFTDLAADVAAPWADVADNILKVSAAMAALAAGGIAYSINEFSKFEDTMLKVKGILGASQDEYQALTDVTRDLGATTRYTAKEAAEGLQFLALAGFSTTEAMSALPKVLQLAQASAVDLGTAADIVTNIMAGYGVEVGNLGAANDVLTATFTNSNTNLEQLGAAFKFVGPVAKGLGLELSETAAILGVLGNAGYQAEMGGTGLRNILLALVAPAGNMGKLFKELGVDTAELGVDLADSKNALISLGVSVKDSDGNLRPFADILDDIKAGLEKIPDPADRTATLIEIFGKRGGPQLAALLEQGSGAVRGLQDKINSLGGVTQKIADEMESGIGGSIRNFRSALQEITLSIGDNMGEALKGTIDGATAIERAFAQLIKQGTFDQLFDAVGEFGIDLEKVLRSIAANLPEAFKGVKFDGVIDSFKSLADTLKSSFEAVFGKIDLTTVEGLRDALEKSVTGIEKLIQVTDGIIQGMRPIFEAIGFGINQFESMDAQGAKLAGTFLGVAKDIQFLTGHLDLFKIALLPLAGATMINAGVNVLTLATSAVTAAGGMGGLIASLTAIATHPAFAVLASAGIGWTIGSYIRDLTPAVDDAAQGFFRLLDKVINFSGQKGNVNLTPNLDDIGKSAADTAGSVLKIPENIDKIPDKKESTITIDGVEYSIEQLKLIQSGMNISSTNVQLNVTASVTQAESNINVLKFQLEDGTWASIKIDADKKALTNTTDALKNNLDPFKTLEIKSELDIAKIQADAKKFSDIMSVFNTQIEWSAKIDIAEIEADAKKVQAAFESIGSSVVAVSGTVESMFSGLTKATGSVHFNELLEVLKTEMKTQDKLVDAQIKLIEAQIKSMAKGEAMFTISGENVSQGARAFMMDVLKEIQIEMSGNAQSYLMGAKT